MASLSEIQNVPKIKNLPHYDACILYCNLLQKSIDFKTKFDSTEFYKFVVLFGSS